LFASIEHELLNVHGDDEHYVREALNHYDRPPPDPRIRSAA